MDANVCGLPGGIMFENEFEFHEWMIQERQRIINYLHTWTKKELISYANTLKATINVTFNKCDLMCMILRELNPLLSKNVVIKNLT